MQISTTASRLFSATLVPFSTNRSPTKPTKLATSWAPSASTNLASLSSRNLFTREIWGWVNSKTATSRREMRGVVRAEMFGQLTSGLEAAWTKLKGEEVLTKENIVEPMRDIRRALLEADVSLPVVRRFVQAVSDQAVGVGLIRGVKPDQQLVKIVNDELVKLMGGEVSELVFSKSGPTVILLAGLQGVGKTTLCAKLANYLKKQGKSSMLIAGDVYRPAAIDQLVILGEQVGVPVYTAGTEVKPSEIAKQGLEEAKKKKIDVVIMDTAGRLQIDKGMMDELKEVKKVLNPTEVLLVVDAMTGQEAAALVTTFNVEIGITGAILTKLDGDSRGGAALSVKEVSGKPIKLVGRGERMEDLEPFYPDRMAGRILGMGDVLSFVEKAQEVMRQEDAEELQKKIMSAKFDFNDFLKQTRAVARMGSMTRVIGMIPGMGKLSEFDKGKRSCRRRLAGHNERRRKPPPGSLFSSPYENGSRGGSFIVDFSAYPRLPGRDAWPAARSLECITGNRNTATGSSFSHPWQNNSNKPPHDHFLQGSPCGTSFSSTGISPGECFTGSGDSSCALSLLSNQPWGSRNQALNFSVNGVISTEGSSAAQPTTPHGAVVNPYSNASLDFNGSDTVRSSHKMLPHLDLGQIPDPVNRQFSSDLELSQQSWRSYMEHEQSRAAYDDSMQHIHWTL